MPADSVFQIKVTLAHIRPPVWRRLQVPTDVSLGRLHQVIQTAMGWKDYHLHVFETPTGDYGRPDWELGHRNESNVLLCTVAPTVGSKISYTYDFGDDWVHHIEIERVLPRDRGTAYPRCLTGRRACPPEDSGGPWGYGEFLAAITDPHHEQHAELTEWIGGTFNPNHLDIKEINKQLQLLTSGTSAAKH
ncbi:plasmid pRiA4b ORF-3 family protein [Streptomyces sp. NPDC058572]|uniref:plasmid pRiA4b ORF-3 family protein n=1 Tax=Streptomyces sp. NPDC058572 TaxID=3346546 RepID=UPI00366392C1